MYVVQCMGVGVAARRMNMPRKHPYHHSILQNTFTLLCHHLAHFDIPVDTFLVHTVHASVQGFFYPRWIFLLSWLVGVLIT